MTSIVSTTIGKTVSAAVAKASPPLTPSQQAAFRMLTEMTQAVPVVVLEGGPGSGKTILLSHLQAAMGGRLIDVGDALNAIGAGDPMATTTRQEIIRHYASRLPPAHQGFDVARLAVLTEGFTPADLRRTVDDAKAFMAYDMFMKRPQKPFGAYVHAAGAAVRDLRNRVAKATGQPELPKSSDDFDTISTCC